MFRNGLDEKVNDGAKKLKLEEIEVKNRKGALSGLASRLKGPFINDKPVFTF